MSHFSDQFIAACDARTSDDDHYDRVDGVDSRPQYPARPAPADPKPASPFTKTIEPQFERVGRRTKLAGHVGQITDESGLVLHSQLYDTQPQAEQALDSLVRELLADYAERGLVDTVPMADDDPFGDPRTDEEKRESVEGWAEFAPCDGYPFGGWEKPHVHPFDDTRTVMVRKPRLFAANPPAPEPPIAAGMRFEHLGFGTGTVINITDDERLNVQVKFDSPSRFGSKFWFDASEIDPPGENPLGDSEGDPDPPVAIPTYACTRARPCTNPRHDHARIYAVTAQSRVIERRIAVCRNPSCQGIHATQDCPELRAALFVDDQVVYATDEIADLWAVSRTLLAAKLARLTRAQLHVQAIAFAAWLNEQTHAGLSAASILHIWETFILAGDDPAGMAMQVAA